MTSLAVTVSTRFRGPFCANMMTSITPEVYRNAASGGLSYSATAIGNRYSKVGEDRTCSSGDMHMLAERLTADKETHKQTRSSQYSATEE